jgi:hypothetical protein
METFTSSTFLDAQQMNQEEGLLLSNLDVKNLTILRELPFVVSFQERVKILQRIILYDRKDHQSEMGLNWGDQAIQVTQIGNLVCNGDYSNGYDSNNNNRITFCWFVIRFLCVGVICTRTRLRNCLPKTSPTLSCG